jgi:PhnB protein
MTDFRPKTGVTPYLNIDGARKAIDFYKQAFGAIEHEALKGENSDKIMHSQIEVNGSPIFICDFFPEYGHVPVMAQGFNLHLHVDDAQKWWDRAVGAGCSITLPLKAEFWGDIYGQIKDPFGVTWAIGQSQTSGQSG